MKNTMKLSVRHTNGEIEAAKAKLASDYGLERNRRFDLAFDIAWRHGHSYGFNEVACYFDDLVPLIREP
jgi:hypothetical protein